MGKLASKGYGRREGSPRSDMVRIVVINQYRGRLELTSFRIAWRAYARSVLHKIDCLHSPKHIHIPPLMLSSQARATTTAASWLAHSSLINANYTILNPQGRLRGRPSPGKSLHHRRSPSLVICLLHAAANPCKPWYTWSATVWQPLHLGGTRSNTRLLCVGRPGERSYLCFTTWKQGCLDQGLVRRPTGPDGELGEPRCPLLAVTSWKLKITSSQKSGSVRWGIVLWRA